MRDLYHIYRIDFWRFHPNQPSCQTVKYLEICYTAYYTGVFMRTSEVAKLAGVAASTIRAWSLDEFRQYLSPSAKGGSGRTRNFSEDDARILAHIVRLKDEGVEADDIHATLHVMQADNWRGLPGLYETDVFQQARFDPENAPQNAFPLQMIEASVALQRQSLMREISVLESRIGDLNARLETSESNRERLQTELMQAREQLGRAEGKLSILEGERRSSEWWMMMTLAVFTALAVGVVAAVIAYQIAVT
jgi:DNA-binding transcriptional MerR regulator